MAFAALVVFILALGLTGHKPTKGTYLAVGVAAVAASVWEYLS